jgi:hypothetical protein
LHGIFIFGLITIRLAGFVAVIFPQSCGDLISKVPKALACHFDGKIKPVPRATSRADIAAPVVLVVPPEAVFATAYRARAMVV